VEAEDRQEVESGVAYIAPGGTHMTIEAYPRGGYRIVLGNQSPRSGHRPSVDILFESLVPLKELKRHAVLMTGMGSDGAEGMNLLKKAGAVTAIAESAETCIVYGMPKSAIELDCTDYVLPLPEIPKKLIESVQS
jgi:two-component system chemotaxis response regulator CheB